MKNITKKQWIYSISIVAALAVLGSSYAVFGKSESHGAAPAKEASINVTTVTVEPGIVESFISAAGSLNSRNTSVLASKIMGRITELTVQEGDRVTNGQLLMKIESGEISAQVYQAQAAYNNAKLQHDRITGLFNDKAATQMEMDQAILGIESARAGLNAAKAMESYTIISAPIAGQIIEKRINLGEMTLPGQPILKIEDNRNLRLEVTVKEQDLAFIRPNMNVNVQIDALPNKAIMGQVEQVVPASDVRTHSFIVKIAVPFDKNLITGMYGKALFSTGTRKAIMVPKSAIMEMSGLSGVYIVNNEGNAVFQMVQPGDTHGDSIEAVTGLKAGDKLVTNRQTASIDGKKVVVAQKQ